MSRFRGFQGNREESAVRTLEKEHDITKGSDQEPLDTELEAARRMKDGLAAYKRGFSKRVAGYTAIFMVGVAVGVWLFGTRGTQLGNSDWAGDMAKFHAIAVSLRPSSPEANQVIDDLGAGIELPNLTFQTRTLMRVGGENTVTIAYSSNAGVPVNLFRKKSAHADLSDPVVGLRHGLQSATWTKGGIDYLLIGGVDAQLIWDAAKDLSSR